MTGLIISKKAIVRAEFGERIEVPGKQYMPYIGVAGVVFSFVTNAPLVALGFILLAGHAILPTEVKPVQLPPKQRRMHLLLSEDSGDDIPLDVLVQDAIAINAPLARSVMEYIYERAKRDEDGDWIVDWKGQEFLICDFFKGAFEHRNKEKGSALFGDEQPQKKEVPAIGANTKLNAIATPTVPINPSPAIPTTAPITVADAPKSVEELAKEFPAWFKDWCADLLQKTESYTRLPFAPLQKIWLKDHPGNTAQEFSAVLQRHLPQGGTIKPDGGITYIYLTEGKAEEFKGTQVAPKVPGELSVRDRVIVYLQPVGMINVEELLQAFPSEREDVKTALRQLAKEKKLKVNQSTRTVCLNA